MINVYEEMKRSTLSQFYGKRILGGIIRAISEELQEVYEEQQKLRLLLDIDAQEGRNLDNIGDIVCVSREEAQRILLRDEEFEMTDELYRRVLKFMIAMHNSSATYYDIIDGIRMIWNVDEVVYREDRNRPATYFLDLGEYNVKEQGALETRTLTIRAAGVKARYLISWIHEIFHDYWRASLNHVEYTRCISFFSGVRRWDGTWKLNGAYHLNAEAEGKGQVDYWLNAKGLPHRPHLFGVYEIPDRLIVCVSDGALYVSGNEAAISGVKGNHITGSLAQDYMEVVSDGMPDVEDALEEFMAFGPTERSVNAADYLVSKKALSGEFEEDGLVIYYAADVEFSLEMTATKLF